jgi:gliding motility-associated protein GldM
MIGMMYLVLTAMLALNVTKETVKAFMKVDKGLTVTVENYDKKNSIIYNDFEASFAQFPEKTGPYRTKALEIKQRANELFDFIQDIKIMIIKEADGPDAAAIDGRKIDIEKVVKYDENNIPSQILIASNESGKGFALRAALNDFHKFCVETLEGKNPSIEESLNKTLNVEDGPNEAGEIEPWPNLTFQLMPLVGANALLTKIQVDVRNAETEILNYLFSQIDKSNFKFNKLEAVVIPDANYVTVGSNYSAKVFISATDSTSNPTITVGGQVLSLDESGKGIYNVRATATGIKKWGGVISLQAPDGTVKDYHFDTEYSVGEPNANVNPTAVNIMYTTIPNPIDVSVPGIRPDKIKIKVNGGTFSTEKVKNSKGEAYRGNWAVTPTVDAGKIVQVLVTAEDANGKPVTYPPYEFRVKNIPKPEPQLGGKNSGLISRGTLVAMDQVFAVLKDFEFDLTYTVTQFTLSYYDKFGLAEKTSNSSRLTTEQKDILSKLTRGQILTVTNIKARSPSGKIEDLGPIVLKVD